MPEGEPRRGSEHPGEEEEEEEELCTREQLLPVLRWSQAGAGGCGTFPGELGLPAMSVSRVLVHPPHRQREKGSEEWEQIPEIKMGEESWEGLALLCTENARIKAVKISIGYSAYDHYPLFSMSVKNKSRRNQFSSQQKGFLSDT